MFCRVMGLCVVGQFACTSQSGRLRDISQSDGRDSGRGAYGHVTSLLTVNFHPPLVLGFALVSDEYHREVVLAPDSKDLLMEFAGFLE